MKNATLAQAAKLIGKLESGEIDRELAQAIIEGRVQVRPKGMETAYTFTIDRATSFADMVAAGNYDRVDHDITPERFPFPLKDGRVMFDVVLVCLNAICSTNEVRAELDRRGLAPAGTMELLAFGTSHPELQREFDIVALDASWRSPDGVQTSLCLSGEPGERHVSLNCSGPAFEWNEQDRFLAIRKPKGSETSYTITIDRSKSLADMVAAGKYGWVNKNLTKENFTLPSKEGVEEVEVILVHVGELLTNDEVRAELDRRGLVPAGIAELLAFGAVHPELPRGFDIAAIGSVWHGHDGGQESPVLCDGIGKQGRGLGLELYHDTTGRWSRTIRFLAVRK